MRSELSFEQGEHPPSTIEVLMKHDRKRTPRAGIVCNQPVAVIAMASVVCLLPTLVHSIFSPE